MRSRLDLRRQERKQNGRYALPLLLPLPVQASIHELVGYTPPASELGTCRFHFKIAALCMDSEVDLAWA